MNKREKKMSEVKTEVAETTNPAANETKIFPDAAADLQKAAAVVEDKSKATETKETVAESKVEPAKETQEQKTVAESKVPEKYELKIPEGSDLDADAVERISSFAKEKGLTNDQAQELLNREHEAVQGFKSNQMQLIETKKLQWVEQLKTDKELGGENFAKSVEESSRVIKKYFPESFQKELEKTGLGNYPDLVRGFARIGKAMANDTLVTSGAQSGGKKAMEDYFYKPESENQET
jgi:hypothetical protein